MTRKNWIITASIAGGIVVVAAIAVLVVLNTVNTRAEKQVREELDAAIAESPVAEALSYESLDVQSGRGRVTLRGVSLEEEGQAIAADTVSVRLPRGEAIALVRNPQDATITDITVEAANVESSSEIDGSSVRLATLGFSAQGNVPTALFGENPEAAMADATVRVSRVALHARGMTVSAPGREDAVSFGNLDVEARGQFGPEDLGSDPARMLESLESFSAELSEFAMEPDQAFVEGLRSVVGRAPLLENPDNWKLASLAFKGEFTEEGLEVSTVSADSPLLAFEGRGAIGLTPELQPKPPLEVNLDVSRFHTDLRPMFQAIAQSMPTPVELPEENAFELNLSVGEDGRPEVTLE
jgi:hypothetical protein